MKIVMADGPASKLILQERTIFNVVSYKSTHKHARLSIFTPRPGFANLSRGSLHTVCDERTTASSASAVQENTTVCG